MELSWNFIQKKTLIVFNRKKVEKNGKYIVSGRDSSGKNELFEKISKKEAEKKINESIKEISKYMFRQIK